jgi:hypothetical protein
MSELWRPEQSERDKVVSSATTFSMDWRSELTVFLAADEDLGDKGTSDFQELSSNRKSSITEFL